MKYRSARVAIHAAYLTGERGIDHKELANMFGIDRSRRGADMAIVDHVEKGYIQLAMDRLKDRDPVAYAWNLFAYAPPGTGHGFERSQLLQWLMERYSEHYKESGMLCSKAPILARIAMHDFSVMDRSGKKGRRRPHTDFEQALMIPPGTFKDHWHRRYFTLYDFCKELPERGLPPIGTVIEIMHAQAEGEPGANDRLREVLGVVA